MIIKKQGYKLNEKQVRGVLVVNIYVTTKLTRTRQQHRLTGGCKCVEKQGIKERNVKLLKVVVGQVAGHINMAQKQYLRTFILRDYGTNI